MHTRLRCQPGASACMLCGLQAAALHAPYDAVASAAVMDDLSELLSSEMAGGKATMSVERGRGEDGVG